MTALVPVREDEKALVVIEQPTPPTSHGRLRRARQWLRQRRGELLYLVPLVTIAALASRIGFAGSPQRIDDEGTYVAQAWAVENLGQLGHYTYWYDHPPLGWIQIASWTWATDAFARYGEAVLAGREAMVVAHVISVALLWMLARRLRLGRPAAAAALLIYALSPLAVQFTRTVYLDNVATPWALAAFALALSRTRQLLAFAASAAFLAIAVLTKETYLLLAPFLAWQMWRTAQPTTRRYTLSVATAVFSLIGVAYVAFALVKGELVPGSDRVSLWEGITFQLFDRAGSGSVLDSTSQAGRSVSTWLTLDPVLAVASIVAAVVALAIPALRPYAVLQLFLTAVLFKPGYLPVPQVIVMIPFAALLVAGVLDAALRQWRRGPEASTTSRVAGRTAATAGLVGALAFVVAAVPLWSVQLRGLFLADLDAPMTQAQAWVTDNVDRDQRLLIDDVFWVDFVEAGFPRQNTVWYYKADTDPAVSRLAPNGWRDYDYVVVTQALRRTVYSVPTVDDAVANGTRVAVFGSGENEVEIYRVEAQGADAYATQADADRTARIAAGRELLTNPNLDLSDDAATALRDGQVDSRIVTLLALLAGNHQLSVTGFPTVFGEQGQIPARTVSIGSVDGQPVDGQAGRALETEIKDQVRTFEPEEVDLQGGDLIARYGLADDVGLLPAN